MKKKIVLLLLFFSFSFSLSAQISLSEIIGKIIDKKTQQPVVYASVILKNINRGTHADFDGLFEIPIKHYENETIIISSIGFKTIEIKLSTLKKGVINTIYLSEFASSLDEIIIVSNKKKKPVILARQIVYQAIQKIPQNYPQQPYSYISYYRDYQQPINDEYQKFRNSKEPINYLNLNEGIVEVYDAGFSTDVFLNNKNQIALYNYTPNKNFALDSTLNIPYDNAKEKFSKSVFIPPLGGNELNILKLTNAIRNYKRESFSFANVFERDFIAKHKFNVLGTTYKDGEPLYEIQIIANYDEINTSFIVKGKIYISKRNFAIYKLDYSLSQTRGKDNLYAITIDFSNKNDLMYLNYISFHNYFEAKSKMIFTTKDAILDEKKLAIKIIFNREVDVRSIKTIKRKVSLKYKGEKLKVVRLEPIGKSNKKFYLYLDPEHKTILKDKKRFNFYNYFDFKLENIKDINGYKINKEVTLKFNQYRELFVQEIFENKPLPNNIKFIDKAKPLSKSTITKTNFTNQYWVNSPLKKSKN